MAVATDPKTVPVNSSSGSETAKTIAICDITAKIYTYIELLNTRAWNSDYWTWVIADTYLANMSSKYSNGNA